MAKHTSILVADANAFLNDICDDLNNGFVRIYNGTIPANLNAALSGNTLLAQLTLGADAFQAASNGSATANAITADASADNSGTATFFRLFQSDGTTARFQGNVGVSAGAFACVVNSVTVNAGVSVTITSLVITLPTTVGP